MSFKYLLKKYMRRKFSERRDGAYKKIWSDNKKQKNKNKPCHKLMANFVFESGRVVRDPELKKTPNGVSVATVTIAVDSNYTKSGEERRVDFFDVVCWRQLAEFVCKYFGKGSNISVSGSLHTNTYETKDGTKRTVYEISADRVEFAGTTNPPAGANAASTAPAAKADNTETAGTTVETVEDEFGDLDFGDLNFG